MNERRLRVVRDDDVWAEIERIRKEERSREDDERFARELRRSKRNYAMYMVAVLLISFLIIMMT